MTVQKTINIFLLFLLAIDQSQAGAKLSLKGLVAAGCSIKGALAAAVGPNAQSGESCKVMSGVIKDALKSIGINSMGAKDGLVWLEDLNKTNLIALENVGEYVADMEDWFVYLNKVNPESGLVSGNNKIGFGLDEVFDMHVFNGYGVSDRHGEKHTSLAIIYKSKTDNNKFVMMKIDLQTGSGDMAKKKDEQISIFHEIKIVNGINRKVWDMEEKYMQLSLNQLFQIMKKTIDETPKIYDIFGSNCITFKTNILKNMKAWEKSTIAYNVPEKMKPIDTKLLGHKILFCK